ncbi:MAG: HAD hydrolase-like protein, partial [Candidatus Saccharimonadales bacterium]
HGLKRKDTVYIGDETRDIQAARMAFIRAVSVTWGFNTRRILEKQRPAYLIDTPEELLSIRLKEPA